MERIALRRQPQRAAERALEVLRNDGIVIFPTDTVYGVGGDALQSGVLRRVQKMKGRSRGKPLPWLVADLRMAKQYACFSRMAKAHAQRAWPGATTIVLPKRGRRAATVALRVPKHGWLRQLIAQFRKPIIGTSANRSGSPPARTARVAARMLPDADLVIDGGVLRSGPSEVVDWTADVPRILRKSSSRKKMFLAARK